MAAKKRGKKAVSKAGGKAAKTRKAGRRKPAKKKAVKRKAAPKKARSKKTQSAAPAKHVSHEKMEKMISDEIRVASMGLFKSRDKWALGDWVSRYSPVIISMIVGLATYFWLIFYLFYPQTLLYGHFIQLLILLIAIFFIVGVLVYLGMRSELLFIRMMSFIFVFIIITFLLLFVLIAHSMFG